MCGVHSNDVGGFWIWCTRHHSNRSLVLHCNCEPAPIGKVLKQLQGHKEVSVTGRGPCSEVSTINSTVHRNIPATPAILSTKAVVEFSHASTNVHDSHGIIKPVDKHPLDSGPVANGSIFILTSSIIHVLVTVLNCWSPVGHRHVSFWSRIARIGLSHVFA